MPKDSVRPSTKGPSIRHSSLGRQSGGSSNCGIGVAGREGGVVSGRHVSLRHLPGDEGERGQLLGEPT